MKRTRPIALIFVWFAALLASSPARAADIRPAVSAAAQDGTLTRVLVILKTQADLSGATSIQNRKGKGPHVFGKLREAAGQTQGPVVAAIQGMGLAAKPFFIMNAIYVEARPGTWITPQQLEALGAAPGVAKIRSAEIQADRPVEKKKVTAQDAATYSGPQPNIVQIGAPTLWAKGYSGQGVVIGFIDTGEDATFPDIATKYRGYKGAGQPTSDNYNFFDPSSAPCPNPVTGNPMPCDTDGHGTFVTGTAVGSNPVFQIGVAPDAQWIGCRGITAGATVNAILTCLQWMLAPTDVLGNNPDPTQAPDIVNNSYFCSGCDIDYAFTALRSAGIVPVAAIGNLGPYCLSAVEPGGYPDVVGVGAVFSNGTITAFSSRGPYVDYNDNLWAKPDVTAPGAAIVSALANTTGYTEMAGTSMSSPHVAGEIALLLSANPSLDFLSSSSTTPQPADISVLLGGVTGGANATLNSTCDLYGPTGQVYGAGTINVPNTLQVLLNANPLLVTSTDPPELPASVPLSIPVGARGGTPAYSWALTSPGTLPAGLTFSPGVGVLSGTPSLGGSSFLQFQVTDSAHGSGTAFINLSVLGFAATGLPAGTVGTTYFATPGAAGGSGYYTFQFSCLPPGLSDDGLGDITGTPTQAGAFNICATVTDIAGAAGSATQNLTLTIGAPSLAAPVLTMAFGIAPVPVGGSAVLTFTVYNPGASSQLTGVGFTDVLPSGFVVSSPAGLSGSCLTAGSGNSAGQVAVGAGSIALSGLSLNAGASCGFSVNVTAISAGPHFNATSPIGSVQTGLGSAASATLNVIQGSQSIAFATLPAKTYGAGPFTVGATATSNLAVTFAASGPCSVSSGMLQVTGAGSCVITASQAGNGNYAAATPVSQTLTINKAVLTVAANSATMTAGTALPALAASFTGFVNGDSIAVIGGAPGLTTTATAASAAGVYAITVTPGTLAAANYSFAFVNGTLTIVANISVAGGAAYGAGIAAPNTILTLFGSALSCQQNPQVLVNGISAQVLFANATQINFVVPGASTGNSATIQVICNGNSVGSVTMTAAPVDPAIFTETGSGTGAGAILNLDGTLNTPANPIAPGSYISVYVTGFGSLNPPSPDGLQSLTYPVTATIGGIAASVIYAGEAPGQTAGLQQINIQVPASAPAGPNVQLALTANGVGTQAGITVAIQ